MDGWSDLFFEDPWREWLALPTNGTRYIQIYGSMSPIVADEINLRRVGKGPSKKAHSVAIWEISFQLLSRIGARFWKGSHLFARASDKAMFPYRFVLLPQRS